MRKFTEQPPDFKEWGYSSSADEYSDSEEVYIPRLAVGMRVEGYFKLDADTEGAWFPGKIVSENAAVQMGYGMSNSKMATSRTTRA